MKFRILLVGLVIVLMCSQLVLASCDGEEETPAPTQTPITTPTMAPTPTPVVQITPTQTPDMSIQYESDTETIQTAVANNYGDVHVGLDISTNSWCYKDGENGHWFPTSNGEASSITTDSSQTDGDYDAELLYIDADEDMAFTSGEEVTDVELSDAAIWMGLLVNPAADGSTDGCTDRGAAAPLTDEDSMYLTEFPETSSSEYNGNPATSGGTYTWIVGLYGEVFGAYKADDGNWYSGFSGIYP